MCNENGTYQLEIGGSGTMGGGTVVGSGSSSSGSTNTIGIPNSTLSLGANTIWMYCEDTATNIGSATGAITKVQPTPSMTGQVLSFADLDNNYDGLDGRDMTTTWNASTGTGFSGFDAYYLYVIPSSVTINTATQTPVASIFTASTSTWTGDSTITKDSTNTNLVSGSSYIMCIAILGTSGQIGTPGCSSTAVLTADTVSHPSVLSASFVGGTILQLTTDATLDTTLTNNSGGLVSYQVAGTTHTGTAVASVSGKTINITIPSLPSTASTGTSLIVATGALHVASGGYNNYFSSGGLTITDGQAPTITSFATGTIAGYANFYSGSLTFNYTLSETLTGNNLTTLIFTRTAGNPSSAKTYQINASQYLATGSDSISVNLVTLGLISGTTYSVQLSGRDLAGNVGSSSTIAGIAFDDTGPTAPTLTTQANTSNTTPTLVWSASTDDSGSGSGIKQYDLTLFNGASCGGSSVQSFVTGALSQTVSALANGTYSWVVYALDNMLNVGTTSSCSSFTVDTSSPTITSPLITDMSSSSTTYTKSVRTIDFTAGVTNTDSGHIWLDLASLSGSGGLTAMQCSSPVSGVTCSLVSGTVTVALVVGALGSVGSDGSKQISIHIQNPAGINDQTKSASITVINTPPSVSSSTITSPNGSEVW